MNERIDRVGEDTGIAVTIFVSAAITVALCVLNFCVHVPNPDAILLVAIVFFSLVYGYAGGVTSGIVTVGYTFFYYSDHSGGSISVTEGNFEKIVVMIVAIIFMVIMVGMLKKKFDRKNQELMDSNNKLQALVTIDPLTGLSNRRALDDIYEMYLAHAIRNRQPISCIIIDIDDFKQINDTFGHLKGDECLQYAADVLDRSVKRASDFVGRYGGDEFVILLPDTDEDGVKFVSDRLRSEMAKMRVVDATSTQIMDLTVSAGLATMIPDANAEKSILLKYADRALYEAKRQGKNRMVVYKDQ